MSTDAAGEEPKAVKGAVICLWISAGLTLVVTALQLFGVVHAGGVVLATVTGLVNAGMLALVAVKISAGRGWARWVFVILYVGGSCVSVVYMMITPQVFLSLPKLLQASGFVQFGLQTIALILMCTGASRRWFRAHDAQTAP